MRKVVFLLWIVVSAAAAFGQDVTQGSLLAVGKTGKELGTCPLKTTAVKADISGFTARVRVRQEFVNSYSQPIEAVYIFPLSQNGAVDQMTMTVGTRVVRGKIMKRDEARQTYETARSEGKTASLLDQERPNIFTQSVANIMPGESVIVEISYVETLKYEDGAYEFVFPMVVAPRYTPGSVRDAARISPPPARSRGGHDISVEVNLNAGVPVEEIRSVSHQIEQIVSTSSSAKVTLRSGRTIPNKDFILRYDVTGKRIEDAVLTHRDQRGGFFTLILQPPDKIATEDRTPKEIVFVLDTSGSMEGFPIEKAKEAMRLSLDGLYPEDTFNLITFAGDTEILFDKPVPATQSNLEKAQAFLAEREGAGGTEMMTAIKAALAPSDAQDHLRIVCFMTDGEVGNDDEIVAEVQRHPNARVFSFGIGESVNRSLLDKIALEGNGEAVYIALKDDGSKAARKFYERVRTPLLTDLSIDWNGLPVTDIYPTRLTDLFSAKPVIIHGRYSGPATGVLKLKGKVAGQPYERAVSMNLPAAETGNDMLASLWARTRIDGLASDLLKAGTSEQEDDLTKQITDLGLEFGLLTSFTSFVAVEDRVVNQNGKPVTVQVPIETPDRGKAGDSDSDSPGDGDNDSVAVNAPKPRAVSRKLKSATKRGAKNKFAYMSSGAGTGSGVGSGSGMGMGNGPAPAPKRPATISAGVVASEPAPPPPVQSVVHATVDVTVSASETVEITNSSSGNMLMTRNIQQLPKSTSFSSLLKLSPGVKGHSRSGGFVVDGASGTENTFVIDGTDLNNFRTGAPATNNTGSDESEFEGKTRLVVRPEFPAAARASRTGREVAVDILVDVLGNVVSAKAVSGNAALRRAAETAALLTRFAPTLVERKAVRLAGTIVYNFNSAKRIDIGVKSIKAVPPTAADNRLAAINDKLHFWLAGLVQRLDNGITRPAQHEEKYVSGDTATIQVQLTAHSESVLAAVKAAGLEVTTDRGKTLTGRIRITRIAALAEIIEVKLILPRI